MAALVRGLMVLGEQVLRADLLYILFARGYVHNLPGIAGLQSPSPRIGADIPRAGTTVIVVTQTATAPQTTSVSSLALTPTEYVTITPTVDISTSESISADLTTSPSKETQSYQSSETSYTTTATTTTTTKSTTTSTTRVTTSKTPSTTTTTTPTTTTVSTTILSTTTLSTTILSTTVLSTTVTSTTTSLSTVTSRTPPTTDTESQGQRGVSDRQSDLPDCNFPVLELGAFRLRPPPLDVSEDVGLKHWKAAVHQLGETRRLLERNRETLVKQQGAQVFNHLHAELENLVEKPLRYSCKVLQSLQAKLLDLSTNTTGFSAAKNERISKLASVLDEFETELKAASNGTGALLPSWVYEARELWSTNCPNRDCLIVNGTRIETFAGGVPRKLLDAVVRLKQETTWNFANVWKAFIRRMSETYTEVKQGFILFYQTGQPFIAVLIFFLWFNVLLFVLPFWQSQLRNLGAARRRPEPAPEPEPAPPQQPGRMRQMRMEEFILIFPDMIVPEYFDWPQDLLPPPGIVLPAPRPRTPDAFDPADPNPNDGPADPNFDAELDDDPMFQEDPDDANFNGGPAGPNFRQILANLDPDDGPAGFNFDDVLADFNLDDGPA
ncbi:hypothetical protein F5Y08DRAFT_353315 [Xylaria arbuscula]|nr:hypothetical protein F5Y08DRAFT_353315 [Xylaria arbuscula]